MTGPFDLVVTAWGARFAGRRIPCAVGFGGVGGKAGEGDGITPRGTWRLAEVWYRPDRVPAPGGPLPLRAIGPADIWSDDGTDPRYNRHRRDRAPAFGHEKLRRGDPLYDLLAVVDFNWPDPVPGAGSAIFLHRWRGPRVPTAGCVAFRGDDLAAILSRWTPRSRLVIR
ncbi:MAG: L,D-transpeptidase family protein [Pseudomonadota bacterium]